ncbi:MAG: YdbH domain-containing protein [Rickettsiales bacterium]
MKRPKSKTLIFLLLAIVAVMALLVHLVPYKELAAQKITQYLEQEGLKVNKLQISQLTDNKLVISKLDLGDDKRLKLENINVTYDLSEVVNGKIRTLTIDSLELELYKDQGQWKVGGLEELLSKSSSNNIATLIPDSIIIKDIAISGSQDDISFSSNAKLEASYTNQQLNGVLSAPINISTPEFSIATLMLDVSINSDMKNLFAKITVRDHSKTIKLDAEITTEINNLSSGKILVKQIQFPVSGGVLSSKNITAPLAMNKPIEFKINLANVELAQVLGAVTNGEISGQGKLNGSIPVVYYSDGKLEIKEGYIDSHNNGIITVSPNIMPGDNPQIVIARTVLQNFHYNNLRMTLSSTVSNKSNINLSIEGRNPQYLDGKKVKLNVTLSGDTIPMIQQSLLPINDVKQLIDAGKRDEK